jgi:hypothetical protein
LTVRAGGATHEPFKLNPQLFACCLLFPLLLPNSELFRPPTGRLVSRGIYISSQGATIQKLCAKSSWQYRGRANELKASMIRALQDIPGVVQLVAGQLVMVDGKEERDSVSRCRLNMPIERTITFWLPV